MSRKLDLTYSILVFAVMCALGFIFLLARENGKLKTRIAELLSNPDATGDISGPPELRPGDVAAPFEATDWNGKPVSIRYDGKTKYLFFVFSAFCGSCQSQASFWSELAVQAKSGGYQPVGVSLEDPGKRQEIFEQLKKNATLLVVPNLGIQRTFRATALPLLALAAADGTIEWVHYGVLSEGQFKQLLPRLGAPR